jgi:hypothetical protein
MKFQLKSECKMIKENSYVREWIQGISRKRNKMKKPTHFFLSYMWIKKAKKYIIRKIFISGINRWKIKGKFHIRKEEKKYTKKYINWKGR